MIEILVSVIVIALLLAILFVCLAVFLDCIESRISDKPECYGDFLNGNVQAERDCNDCKHLNYCVLVTRRSERNAEY
jgi:hypothetical protein